MAKLEKLVLAEDSLHELKEAENSERLAEEAVTFVQKKLHRRESGNVDQMHNCNIEDLHVTGVDLLSKVHNLENRFVRAFVESKISELPIAEFDEQIQLCLAELKQLCTLYSIANPKGTHGYDSLEFLRSSDLISQTRQGPPCLEESDLVKELSAKLIEIEKLKSDNLVKDNELEALRRRQKQLEAHICSVEEQKSQLEENMEIMRREVVVMAKFLDDLRSEVLELDSNMDSRISAEKILAKKSSKLEDGKQEIEVYLSELEEGNLLLSEGLCALEEKLMYPNDKSEYCHMELQIPEFDAMNFKDEIIRRLGDEMEVQRFVMRQKIEEMQRQWLVVQEECEYLKIENLKLVEECSILHKENDDIRKQTMELNVWCTVLEVELRESENLRRENQLLEEEILAQLQKKVLLQDEILALKETMSEIKFENEILETSFVMLSRDYEELKAEMMLILQKISSSCRCDKVSLADALENRETSLKNEQSCIQVDNDWNCNTESQFMGVELAEVLEVDDLYKTQLKSFQSNDVRTRIDVPANSTGESAGTNDRYECKAPILEIEMSAMYQIC
ncbi:sarcolemmal membrane-associated protein-like isoform X1 [Hibiscus syriacus]|uniref:sarcolemmal membrane-associated protein-like isoform X1 n=1 Tax=Hibiscus syriacus TaxID=106335 RepID=UPI001924EB01|nr:sarcolemmal membrane-associated protein-like isoform X1 [Hibiscus syriacus]